MKYTHPWAYHSNILLYIGWRNQSLTPNYLTNLNTNYVLNVLANCMYHIKCSTAPGNMFIHLINVRILNEQKKFRTRSLSTDTNWVYDICLFQNRCKVN